MVGLFFVVNGKILLYKCDLDKAEKNGKFLNYPKSHMQIWDKYYYKKYHVDFDFYPRGRIIYNTETEEYYIYYDKCLEGNLDNLLKLYEGKNIKLLLDFHCNKNYVV